MALSFTSGEGGIGELSGNQQTSAATAHEVPDYYKAAPGCQIQCITSGLAYARGARFLDDEGEKWLFNTPEARETVQYIVDLIYKHDVHPDAGESSARTISGAW